MLRLSEIFALEISAYSVMSNQYHIKLYISGNEERSWSDKEVIKRWHRLFKGSMQNSIRIIKNQVEECRNRLNNVSWFMRILNEKIARKTNKEEGSSGRFWAD